MKRVVFDAADQATIEMSKNDLKGPIVDYTVSCFGISLLHHFCSL